MRPSGRGGLSFLKTSRPKNQHVALNLPPIFAGIIQPVLPLSASGVFEPPFVFSDRRISG